MLPGVWPWEITQIGASVNSPVPCAPWAVTVCLGPPTLVPRACMGQALGSPRLSALPPVRHLLVGPALEGR